MHFVRLRIEGDDFPDAVLFFSAADPVQASVRAFAFADRMKATHVVSGEVSAESIDWMMKQLQADAERRDELLARLGGILEGADIDKVMRFDRLKDKPRHMLGLPHQTYAPIPWPDKVCGRPWMYSDRPLSDPPMIELHSTGGVFTSSDQATRRTLERMGLPTQDQPDGTFHFGTGDTSADYVFRKAEELSRASAAALEEQVKRGCFRCGAAMIVDGKPVEGSRIIHQQDDPLDRKGYCPACVRLIVQDEE
jgi:hypothetical protein